MFERAASMIESFCSLVGHQKSTFDVGAPGLRKNDDGTKMRVLSLVEKLASGTSVSRAMCSSFVRICTSFEDCDGLDIMEQATALLLRNIISARG